MSVGTLIDLFKKIVTRQFGGITPEPERGREGPVLDTGFIPIPLLVYPLETQIKIVQLRAITNCFSKSSINGKTKLAKVLHSRTKLSGYSEIESTLKSVKLSNSISTQINGSSEIYSKLFKFVISSSSLKSEIKNTSYTSINISKIYPNTVLGNIKIINKSIVESTLYGAYSQKLLGHIQIVGKSFLYSIVSGENIYKSAIKEDDDFLLML